MRVLPATLFERIGAGALLDDPVDIMTSLFYPHDIMPPKQVTIRGVSSELGNRLTAIARTRGQSVNTTVLQILESAAGLDERRTWLRRFMTWTPDDVRASDAATKAQRKVDINLWR